MTVIRVQTGVPAGGQFSARHRNETETDLTPSRTPAEMKLAAALDNQKQATVQAATAASAVLAEKILDQLPNAFTAAAKFDEEDGFVYLGSIDDKSGETIWTYDSKPEFDVYEANSLLEIITANLRGGADFTFDLTPYRKVSTFDIDLAAQLEAADWDDRNDLIDDATDDQRQGLATHPSADIRHHVAGSPETDVDTLTLLTEDADPDVVAAARFSLYGGEDE
jgi:hypothetical protein